MAEATQRDHLFISYATEDGALAEWLTLKLTAAGYRVWCDLVGAARRSFFPPGELDSDSLNRVSAQQFELRVEGASPALGKWGTGPRETLSFQARLPTAFEAPPCFMKLFC